jgi:hypothetical protein
MTDPSGQETPEEQLKRHNAEAWERYHAAQSEAWRKRKAKEEQRREARVARARLPWQERWEQSLEALQVWVMFLIVFGTIVITVAAVVIVAFGIDLPWM